jgi:hypothetical protein
MGAAASAAKRIVKTVANVVDKKAKEQNAKAQERKEEAEDRMNTLMEDLRNKLETYEKQVQQTRGPASSKTEVDGGRSVMRVSELRVATDKGVQDQMEEAINSFMSLAQGGNAPTKAAVEGATSMLQASLDALYGVSAGQSMEKQGFVVLFLNYAFVRVDYFVYSYCVSGTKWGAQDSVSGCCYLCDLAVLNLADLTSSEIDFLVTQSLKSDNTQTQINYLTQIKIQMAQSAVLSRILQDKKTNNLDEITKATQAYVKNTQEMVKIFKNMPQFVPKEKK